MKAVLSTRTGGPQTLEWAELPDPVPGPGEVVVAVRAVALNFFDTLIIQDRYQVKPPRPFSPGAEMAGVVAALGPGVAGLAIGDRVVGAPGFGAAREALAVPAERLVKIPETVSFERAAALVITYGTTLLALERGRLAAGETMAVLGASGGVGIAAVELGKLMGARVIACASSPDKLAFCRAHGADETVDYSREDLKERLRALTGGRGVDVVYDTVGGPHAEPALRASAWQGRFLVIGFAAGDIPKIPLNLLLLMQREAIGVYWGAWTERDPAGHRAHLMRLLDWAATGAIAVHIDQVLPLKDAAVAIQALADRSAKGKIVLVP